VKGKKKCKKVPSSGNAERPFCEFLIYNKLSHVELCKANNETQKQETGYKVNVRNFLMVGLNCAVYNPK
jgi:hypothetical protein